MHRDKRNSGAASYQGPVKIELRNGAGLVTLASYHHEYEAGGFVSVWWPVACEHRRISGCRFFSGERSANRKYVCVRRQGEATRRMGTRALPCPHSSRGSATGRQSQTKPPAKEAIHQ